jgi:hypothetical protein
MAQQVESEDEYIPWGEEAFLRYAFAAIESREIIMLDNKHLTSYWNDPRDQAFCIKDHELRWATYAPDVGLYYRGNCVALGLYAILLFETLLEYPPSKYNPFLLLPCYDAGTPETPRV